MLSLVSDHEGVYSRGVALVIAALSDNKAGVLKLQELGAEICPHTGLQEVAKHYDLASVFPLTRGGRLCGRVGWALQKPEIA